jgi:CO/xanthine dehydrogenase Mo-binding subunit
MRSRLYGLTAALFGEITIKQGRVEKGNFDAYPIARMSDAPVIETHFVLSGGDKWGGLGEPGTPPIAPDALGQWLAPVALVRGVAIHEAFGTIVGEIAEVAVSDRGEVKVERVVACVDCGHLVNPLTAAMQIESAGQSAG